MIIAHIMILLEQLYYAFGVVKYQTYGIAEPTEVVGDIWTIIFLLYFVWDGVLRENELSLLAFIFMTILYLIEDILACLGIMKYYGSNEHPLNVKYLVKKFNISLP